jgi:lipid II isoglutaminyl synthase (glutamine-hydrolysing)
LSTFGITRIDIYIVALYYTVMKTIYITHLYPQEMSIYGDMGNIIAMGYRLEKMGFTVVYQTLEQGKELPNHTDWYFIGGGQDKEQERIYNDLLRHKTRLIQDVEEGVGLLAICGGYQLFGHKFLTGNGVEVTGLGVFDVVTKAPDAIISGRCIGNIVTECLIPDLQGEMLVGFENHGGQTTIINTSRSKPLAKVLVGYGNSFEKKHEGCVFNHAIGTYLHGSCLPKNPALTQWFIRNILEKKGLKMSENTVDDSIAAATREALLERFL